MTSDNKPEATSQELTEAELDEVRGGAGGNAKDNTVYNTASHRG